MGTTLIFAWIFADDQLAVKLDPVWCDRMYLNESGTQTIDPFRDVRNEWR